MANKPGRGGGESIRWAISSAIGPVNDETGGANAGGFFLDVSSLMARLLSGHRILFPARWRAILSSSHPARLVPGSSASHAANRHPAIENALGNAIHRRRQSRRWERHNGARPRRQARIAAADQR